jgi:uncharacterized membrane protein YecN with MAPEG domain
VLLHSLDFRLFAVVGPDGDHPGLVRLLAVDLDERHGDCVDAVGELLFPTRVVHVSNYTQSGVITRAVHLVGNGKGLGIIWLVGNHQDP